jgi:hypothetical protein
MLKRRLLAVALLLSASLACLQGSLIPATLTLMSPSPSPWPSPPATVTAVSSPTIVFSTPALLATQTPPPLVPKFAHIVEILFENKEFGTVVNNPQMPYFNELAAANTLLTAHYAVAHPSLPNYLALIAGDTFGVTVDCTKCTYDAVSLPDLVESSGRRWKTYQEDMPSACFVGAGAGNYAMKHNPFVYFESIRLDPARCARSVVPLTQLYADLAAGDLPDFAFITPNLCNDAHDCGLNVADEWLKALVMELLPALERAGQPYVVVITWDEGQGNHSCCDLPPEAGGRIATILVSKLARAGFQDSTPYTHYSLLKTIAASWGLPYLGHAADPSSVLIVAPWTTGN